MKYGDTYLTVTLDLSEPVEVGDFASHWAGIGAEFDTYISLNQPDLKGKIQIYVREVRKGSIIADIVTYVGDLIAAMDSALIVGGFLSLFSNRVRSFISGGTLPSATKTDLKNIHDTIKALAEDSDGVLELAETRYQNGVPIKKTKFHITSAEAKTAKEAIERQKMR